jgi:hypothetical protein
MTTTRSKVTRKTEHAHAVLYTKPNNIIVSILPGDVLEFREAGRRDRFQITIAAAMRYAVQLTSMKIGRRIKELTKAGMSKSVARKRAEKEYLR